MDNNLAELAEARRRRQEQARAQREEDDRRNMEANGDMGMEEERGLLGGLFQRNQDDGVQREKRARDETFYDAIQMNLCPTLRCCTFTVLIIIIDIIMYLISLWLNKIVNTEFLAPNPKALDTLGWKDARKIKKRGQVWRFLTPVFLHASFTHLCLNLLSTIVIGSGLENGLGSWKLATLYFISSIGGVIFSCTFNPLAYSVGASTAIFGLIGYYISYLIIEWSRLGESNPMQRFTLIIFILLILLFNIQIGLTEANVDNLGHLGGLIVGIIMGFAIAENDDRNDRSQGFIDFMRRSNYKNKCGMIFLFCYLLTFLLVFYLVIDA